ncbi:hypothetical protein MTR67_053028 [Solanum verrucosum]|uniref:Uncharacterized protein n=1 Tax=Solanum verrucosum TaxID=315347 RepID=A0AAF1A3B8_SOLVR|nr:hypothetical protein MTR67_053028 [Solanum verrucosum]
MVLECWSRSGCRLRS